jgi:hypothetical protein
VLKIFVTGLAVVSLIGGALFLFGWREPSTYDPDRVKVAAEGITQDGLKLHFQPPAESMYHCPGVLVDYQGSVIRYTYVRAAVGENVPVDCPVTRDQDGNLVVTFRFPNGRWEPGDRMELIDSNGKRQGSWECLTDGSD